MTGIFNFQNRTFLVKIYAMFNRIGKVLVSANASFTKMINSVTCQPQPALKHILTDPALALELGAGLYIFFLAQDIFDILCVVE